MKQRNLNDKLKSIERKHVHFSFGGKTSFILTFGLITFLLYLFICVAPVVTSISYGFFNVSSGSIANKIFVGYQNYKTILSDPIFWKSLGNDGLIVLGKELIIVFLSVFFAVAITKFGLNKKEVGVYRFILYMPAILSIVFIVYFWDNFFDGNYGLFAKILGTSDVAFKSEYPIQIITFVASWCGIGYFMIILISSIGNIPESLYEAAKLDGANQFTQLFRVTLPQIKPQIIFLVVNIISTSLAGNMNLVLPFYGVGNEKTLVMGTYVYYYANNKNQLGFSNAAAVLLMIISFVVCYTLNNTLTKEEK